MEKIPVDGMFAVKDDSNGILGKMLISSLPNVLIEREKLKRICKDLDLPITVGGRVSDRDAFRSAVSSIHYRLEDHINGKPRVRNMYCRENGKAENIISRELVCETLGEDSNDYKKLANIYLIKGTGSFNYTINSNNGTSLDVRGYCEDARKQFELYKICVGRNQLENLIDSYLEKIEALKVDVHGKVYFIPIKNIQMLDIFEDFIEGINAHNIYNSEINLYSLFVADNSKQREKIANEFYYNSRQTINNYVTRIEKLIASNSSNPKLLERWADKAASLQDKKLEYEELLKMELSELDEDYKDLNCLADDLKIKANKLRQK